MSRINKSWREQAKAVVATNELGRETEYRSVWKAAVEMMQQFGCQHDTARKEIRKAIKTGYKRYGYIWRFESD